MTGVLFDLLLAVLVLGVLAAAAMGLLHWWLYIGREYGRKP
mgnify:FL=1